jgi:hypothetical protein
MMMMMMMTMMMYAIDRNSVSPLKFIYWNLTPNVMVFGGGAFGRWLGHKGGILMNGISALIKETLERSLTS